MLSPADYAAYSRATGRSYPQSEEEKAAMYGDVRNFRNEQTKSNDVANLAGGVLLGAGVLGAGVGGAMALRGRRPSNSRRGGVQTRVNPQADQVPGGAAAVERLAKEPPRIQLSPEQAERVERAKQRSPLTATPNNSITDAIVQDNADAGEGFKKFSQRADQIGLEASQAKAQDFADSAVNTMVELQDQREPLVRKQAIEATDTAFDQKMQDLQASVQRNEDIDLGAIDLDSSARRFFKDERQVIAQELADQGITPTPGQIELNLAERVGPESSEYGSKYTRRKQAMQLYATYGGDLNENLRADNVQVGGLNIPVRDLKTEYVSPGTALDSEAKRQASKDFVGDVRLEVTEDRNRRRQNPETQKMVQEFANNEETMNIAAANADMGRDVDFNEQVYDAFDMKNDKLARDIELRTEYTPAELKRIAGAENYDFQRQQEITENFPKRLADKYDEGSYMTVAKDEATGKLLATFDPETGALEPVLERTSGGLQAKLNMEGEGIEPASGTSVRGRTAVTQEGIPGGMGIYGLEVEGQPPAAMKRDEGSAGIITQQGNVLPDTVAASQVPGKVYYTKKQIADKALDLSGADAYGDVPIPATEQEALDALRAGERRAERPFTREEADRFRRSTNMSEAVRKAGYSNYTPTGQPRRQEPVRSSTLARTGRIDQKLADLGAEMRGLRKEVQQLDVRGQEKRMGPRSRVSGLEPQQRTIPGVTGYGARQRSSEADKAAQQLESYMSRLQRGRSTPLTSQAVIQPKLF